tara:strand:+ start:621 stop:926 length:306 start_codon:yes stop_codon:yes gene_type:complete
MITKYSINLSQFNGGESDTITFPTFDQCMMYGVHKLKKSLENGTSITRAILIKDNHDRNIVISPSEEELGYTPFFGKGVPQALIKLQLRKDVYDGDNTFFL